MTIKQIGNNIISDVIYILSQVEITPKDGVDILTQAKLREQRRLTKGERNERS